MRGHLDNHPEESLGWNRDKDIKNLKKIKTKNKTSKGNYETIANSKETKKLYRKATDS